ncbi:MAG: IclR family transcriptional regulator [Thiobacillaceae bacterium]|nr:IclR family transcriptional regulator [Thiobacillaceae bacterium]
MTAQTVQTSIQVIDRMALLLDAMARYAEPASLKYLAADTGLHPSTAHRILSALAEHGYVERVEPAGWQLGAKLLQLGHRVRAGHDVRREARPVMDWLRDEIGESVNLTLREGDEVIYVERATPARAIRVEQVIGSRAPLHVTAVGKLMLAGDGAAGIAAYARRTGLQRYTRNTLADADALAGAADAAARRGYALDDEEAELGVGCIGALIRDATGRVVAGLSVSAPIERRRQEWIPLVVEAARRVSGRLGYEAGEDETGRSPARPIRMPASRDS